MGWDGMGWDGMGWDGMGWDGMGWDGTGQDETGQDEMGQDEMGQDGNPCHALVTSWREHSNAMYIHRDIKLCVLSVFHLLQKPWSNPGNQEYIKSVHP